MRILVAIEGARHLRHSIDWLRRTPFAAPEYEVGVLVVATAAHRPGRNAKRVEEESLALDELQRLRSAGWRAHAIFRNGNVAACIADAASEVKADLVVVGSRDPAAAKPWLTRSVSRKALRCAPCSVLVSRIPGRPGRRSLERKQNAPLRVLIGYDGSPAAVQAVESVASLALAEPVELSIVTVLPLITCFRTDIIQTERPEWHGKREAAQSDLDFAAARLRGSTLRVSTILRTSSNVGDEILRVAEERETEMIVLGHKGRRAIDELLLGCVTNRVAHRARCSVWVVKSSNQSPRRG